MTHKTVTTSTGGSNLVDVIERVLDKGIVIAGDIKVNLVDIELLTIQIRLVVCSVDKAVEMGMDWWKNGSSFLSTDQNEKDEKSLVERIERLESSMRQDQAAVASAKPFLADAQS